MRMAHDSLNRAKSPDRAALVGLVSCVVCPAGPRVLSSSGSPTHVGWLLDPGPRAGLRLSLEPRGRERLDGGGGRAVALLGHDADDAATNPPGGIIDTTPDLVTPGGLGGALRVPETAQGRVAMAVLGDRSTIFDDLRSGRGLILGVLLPQDSTGIRRRNEIVIAVRPAPGEFSTFELAGGALIPRDLHPDWSLARRPLLLVFAPESAVPQSNRIGTTTRRVRLAVGVDRPASPL